MNPQKIAIVTDSCADLSPSLIKNDPIFVLPLKIVYHDRVYSDGVDIWARDVYKRFSQEIPKTSLPDGETILKLFDQIYEMGYQRVIAVNFSSGLSGTHQLVRLLAEEQENLEVVAFDTRTACLGTGAIALRLARYIEQGRAWEEILSLVPRLIDNTHVFFGVDTLEYLQKGGRIGKITSITGTMLQIKPIITFAPTGELTNIAKVRGRRQSMAKVVELAASRYQSEKRCVLLCAHGDAPEDGKLVKKMLMQAVPQHECCYEGIIDATLGVHVGPNLIGAGIQILDDDM